MPEMSLTGWKRKIREHCEAEGIDKTDSQVSRMATKISKRMTQMTSVADWELALRILGISSDPTPAQALIPRINPTRHISTRKPGEPITQETAA